MTVVSKKSARRIMPMAQREFLCTQRRLCADRGFHSFSLRFNGKIDADQASAFFAKCPELDCMIQSDGQNCWKVYLSRK